MVKVLPKRLRDVIGHRDVMEERERKNAEKSALAVFAEEPRKKELKPVNHAAEHTSARARKTPSPISSRIVCKQVMWSLFGQAVGPPAMPGDHGV